MRKIVIAVDDYKEQHFKKELNARGITDFTTGPGVTYDTQNIIVRCEDVDYEHYKEQVRRLCVKLEISKPWKN